MHAMLKLGLFKAVNKLYVIGVDKWSCWEVNFVEG